MQNEYTPLKGEGGTKITVSKLHRCECENCGEPATKKFSFCYINGRNNPASSMYRQDDCTYCSDAYSFSCDECEKTVQRNSCPEGMSWGGTFSAGGRFDHMFLEWVVRPDLSKAILERAETISMLEKSRLSLIEQRDYWHGLFVQGYDGTLTKEYKD